MIKAFLLCFVCCSVSFSLKEGCQSVEEKLEILTHKVAALEKHCKQSYHSKIPQVDTRYERLLLNVNENAHKPIAFSAYMSHSFDGPSFGQLRELIYDKLENNIGNAYSSFTGTFRVPEDGVYAFSWTIFVQGLPGSKGEISVELVINGAIHGVIHADTEVDHDDDTATGFVIKSVVAGDMVFTRISNAFHAQGTEMSNSKGRWSFSGFKIY